MNIILLGIQGAGKSTQGNLLSKQLKIPYLSTGHIFREIAKEKTNLGRSIKELINSGSLIPDKTSIDIVNHYLSRPEYKKGFILDGFARTIEQAKACTFPITKVIYLDLDEKEAIWRLAMRKDERDDNTIQAVHHRVDIFHKHTMPVVKYFEDKGLLAKVDASISIEKVNEEILKSLGKQYIENRIEAWEQKKRIVIALVGLAGSGKSEAVKYLSEQFKLPVISFSTIINEYIDSNGLEHSEKVHEKLRKEFRQKYGMASMAILRKNDLETAISNNKTVLIEGLYSWEEYLYLLEQFPQTQVYLVAIWARKDLRWDRSSKREYRKGLYGEDRDKNELISTNKGPAIAYADYLIINDFTMHQFHDKLDETYRAIIYS